MDQSSLFDYHSLMNEVSRRMAASQLSRRQSRSSSTFSGGTSRRATRVEKPRSIHNSPRGVERRRTISAAFKRFSTADLEQGETNGLSENAYDQNWGTGFPQSARPVSWHPSSTQFSAFQTPIEESAPVYSCDDWVSDQANASQVNDYESQLAYFANYQPQLAYQDQLQSQFYSSGQAMNQQMLLSSYFGVEPVMPTTQEDYLTAVYGVPQYEISDADAEPWPVPDWASFTKIQPQEMIRPVSSNSPPLQNPAPTEETVVVPNEGLDDNTENELVGMGLYDPPEANSSWLMAGSTLGQGKGLKLEETWQPPESSDEDSEEDDPDDGKTEADEDEEEEQEGEKDDDEKGYVAGHEERSDSAMGKEPHQVWTVPQAAPNLSGQSFYFEDDDGMAGRSWFQDIEGCNAPVARIDSTWI